MTRRLISSIAASVGIIIAAHFAVPISAEPVISDLDILKKISSTSIRKAMEGTGDIDDIAAKMGLSTYELKRVCLALRIDLPDQPTPRIRTNPIPVPATKPASTPVPVNVPSTATSTVPATASAPVTKPASVPAAETVPATAPVIASVAKPASVSLPTATPVPKPEPVPVPKPAAPVLPKELVTDAILSYAGETPHVLLVDKDQHFIYLLRYENGKRVVQDVYPCKTGRSIGDKQERGDQRTPEGIYFFETKMTRPEIEHRVGKPNAFQYGDIAFTSDFPNRIDELKGKSGGGIWLHGTDEPFESTPSLDTRGCVVTTNETIQKLSPYIELDKTPMVIVDKLVTQSDQEVEAERQSVLAMIEDWRKTWAEKRIDDYIGHYSDSFSSQGLSRAQWRARKEGLARINGTVRISLENISILKQKDGMVVRFLQDYEADNVANIGVKTLYLIRGGNGWEIVSEHFRKTQ